MSGQQHPLPSGPRFEIGSATMQVPSPAVRLAVVLVAALTVLPGCGTPKKANAVSAASSCSNAHFTAAVEPRLAATDAAILRVYQAHEDLSALTAAAAPLASAAAGLRAAANGHHPCKTGLVKARQIVLSATNELTTASHMLAQFAGAKRKGTLPALENSFLNSIEGGASNFNAGVAALRAAGAPPLVAATDGKGVFTESGCAGCHTLKAAGARAKLGPNLDQRKPATATVISTVMQPIGGMPAFNGKLSTAQIRAVADFVSKTAGQ